MRTQGYNLAVLMWRQCCTEVVLQWMFGWKSGVVDALAPRQNEGGKGVGNECREGVQ